MDCCHFNYCHFFEFGVVPFMLALVAVELSKKIKGSFKKNIQLIVGVWLLWSIIYIGLQYFICSRMPVEYFIMVLLLFIFGVSMTLLSPYNKIQIITKDKKASNNKPKPSAKLD